MTVWRTSVPAAVAGLEPFVAAGVLGPAEVHLAATFARLQPGLSDASALALAVAARGPRLGHVRVALDAVGATAVDDRDDPVVGLPWPEPGAWAAALAASAIAAPPASADEEPLRPLVWDGRHVYLHRYWRHEVNVAADLIRRAGIEIAAPPGMEAALGALFPAPAGSEAAADEPDRQAEAARVALTHPFAVIAGGPGTGKTRTVARLLAAALQLASEEGRPIEVALAAPTGKAAARMTEAVRSAVDEAERDGVIGTDVAARLRAIEATTVHRLLGWAPGASFRHHRHDPLHHDLVIVDETSMVSLPLMARLVAAVRPLARLVLVGDPDQLASVEAGTVMSDIVGPARRAPAPASVGLPGPAGGAVGEVTASAPLAGRITVLRRPHRFGPHSTIAAVADAVRAGDADGALALLAAGHADAAWIADDDRRGLADLEAEVVDAAVDVVRAALDGDAAAGLAAAMRVKVLAATRHRPLGVHDWSDRIEAAVASRVPGLDRGHRWYVGRPVLVTANDPITRVNNGDTGLVVRHGATTTVALPDGAILRHVPPARLDQVETWWAMTIHKSQGSEFGHAVVSLPAPDSPVLSRELLYTAITRARHRVTVVGSAAAIHAAVDRPVTRASGLGARLWPEPGS